MDISSTTSRFVSNLISSSTDTTSKNFSLKMKGSSTIYPDCGNHQGCNKNTRRTHSQIEKRRRDKVNSFIDELASLVPNAKPRKLDKLSVLRMAVQRVKMLRGSAGSRYAEVNHKPAFLSDEELKHLLQRIVTLLPSGKKSLDAAPYLVGEAAGYDTSKPNECSGEKKTVVMYSSFARDLSSSGEMVVLAADGFLFVVDCDQGKILFVSESVYQILNYSQNDLIGQSLFDYLHPKDIGKVKEQLSSAVTILREKTIDAKSGSLVKMDGNPHSLRLCSGVRRSFFCRMKCNHSMEDEEFLSSCLKQNADCKGFCTIHSTGYLKRWSPTEVDLDENNEPDNEGCNLSCLVAVGRMHPHTFSQPVQSHVKVKPMEFVSRHAIDGKFVFVDQSATAIWAYLPQELLGTSFYEYFHEDDIAHLAECHRQVLQMREKINTNCYKLKIKDGSFITLRSRWFSFTNPWTKEVEYIVSTNTVVSPSEDRPENSYLSADSPRTMATVLMPDDGKPGLQTVPGISGGTRAGAGKIGRMIAKELLEIRRMDMSTMISEGQKAVSSVASAALGSQVDVRVEDRGNQAHDYSTTQDVTTSAQAAKDVLEALVAGQDVYAESCAWRVCHHHRIPAYTPAAEEQEAQETRTWLNEGGKCFHWNSKS